MLPASKSRPVQYSSADVDLRCGQGSAKSSGDAEGCVWAGGVAGVVS
jgi:hypothetical protein